MTKQQKKEYVKNTSRCPYCKSENIVAGTPEVDGTVVSVEIECGDCNSVWNDIYKFADVEAYIERE